MSWLLKPRRGPVQFFLRCDPEARFFYFVEFHDTRGQMLQAVAKLEGKKISSFTKLEKETEACCIRYKYELTGLPKKLQGKCEPIGTLFFVRNQAPAGAVIHELTHAVVGWAKRAKIDPLKQSKNYGKCPEERFARTLQYMTEQFYEQAPRALANAA